jgi:periplasmic protein TonB
MAIKKTFSYLFLFTMLFLPVLAKSMPVIKNVCEPGFKKDTIPSKTNSGELKIFEKVEVEAYFPGDEKGWYTYLRQNLNPLAPVDKGAPEGTYNVIIQFIVDKDGHLSDITPLTAHGYGMEAEVVRILEKSPPWIPATQNGKKLRAIRKQHITFYVEAEKKKKRRKDK